MSRISIIGAGYVGLVTGVCLADIGHEVTCVDTDERKVSMISSGRPHIHEIGLEEMLTRNLGNGFSITSDFDQAVGDSDITLIAVGTPSNEHGIDLRFIRAVSEQIGAILRDKDSYHVVTVKSTVVPGTTTSVVTKILEETSGKKAGDGFGVGVNPEFLTEGQAVQDFMQPDRIVIGADGERTAAILEEVYAPFEEAPIIVTTPGTAEMIKYASNAMLATMISFSNELANIGAAIGDIDTVEVMRGVHASRYVTSTVGDQRVTADLAAFLFAGCGFGGSCLPKDVTALAAHGKTFGVPTPMLDAVLAVNALQPDVIVDLVADGLGNLSQKTVGILGLAFKPDTNDTRESPAFPIIRTLAERGATIVTHDPIVTEDELPPDIAELGERRTDLAEVLAASDAVVLVTSWSEYSALPDMLAMLPEPPLVVDGRRMLDPTSVARYSGVGL